MQPPGTCQSVHCYAEAEHVSIMMLSQVFVQVPHTSVSSPDAGLTVFFDPCVI